jgi:outer membrane protein OmpA-like peptidoglycan-associated protein
MWRMLAAVPLPALTDATHRRHVHAMSDETPTSPADGESTPATEARTAESTDAPAGLADRINTVRLLVVVVVMLAGLLIFSLLFRSGKPAGNNAGLADDPRIAALRAELEARRDELNRERLSLNLPPLQGGGEAVDDIAARLRKDAETLVALAARSQQIIEEKNTALSAKNADWLRAEQLRQAMAEENSRLQSEIIAARAAGGDQERLSADLTEALTRGNRLADELAEARTRLSELSDARPSQDFDTLNRRLEETARARDFFETRVAELEAQLARLRLFAESEDQLLPAAMELFRELRGLEGVSGDSLEDAYTSFDERLAARVKRTLTFPTGSATLSDDHELDLLTLANEIPEGDTLLVVGYASTTGDADTNRKLSSDRATSAARMLADSLPQGRHVQAVFLGQTARFGNEAEPNQRCEVWHVRRR